MRTLRRGRKNGACVLLYERADAARLCSSSSWERAVAYVRVFSPLPAVLSRRAIPSALPSRFALSKHIEPQGHQGRGRHYSYHRCRSGLFLVEAPRRRWHSFLFVRELNEKCRRRACSWSKLRAEAEKLEEESGD